MRRPLFRLILLISIIIWEIQGAASVTYTAQEIDDSIVQGQNVVEMIRQIEANLVANGGTLNTEIPSPEVRHQGSGGDDLSKALNIIEELYLAATNDLRIKKGLTNEQVNELQNYNLYDLGGPIAKDAYNNCTKLHQVTTCDPNSLYRTADGTCNNLNNPEFGRSNACTKRFLPPSYNDGVSVPRRSVTGDPLPNVRTVSTTVHNDVFFQTDAIAFMVMQWGQFLDHDMAISPMIRTAETQDTINCCAPVSQQHPACYQINIPPNDPNYGPLGKTCLNFVRTLSCSPNCNLGPKNVVNFPTSYLDGSQIYGSSETEQFSLRTFSGGLLTSQVINGVESLPFFSLEQNHQCTKQTQQHQCFMAGDERVNEQPGLTSMHTIWLRQHNYLARQLQKVSPGLSDESLFQIARKIVGAMIQQITYSEFLQAVLGPDFTKNQGLASLTVGRTSYNPNIDATIAIDFATAAYRFGHSLIRNIFPYKPNGNFSLEDNYFNDEVVLTGHVSSLLLGFCQFPAQKFDQHVVEAVTDHVYQVSGTPFGLDLVALNLQRARDNGIGAYLDYLNKCTGKNYQTFDDLKNLFAPSCLEKVQQVYTSARDIDLFTGGLCETKSSTDNNNKKNTFGGILGPTFKCLLEDQFSRLKFGDRFYYEHEGKDGVIPLTDAQLKEIRKVTLSSVVCKQANIAKINKNAFFKKSKVVRCSKLPQVDVSKFLEF